ncbi:STT3 domain-containing protein [Halosegnis longus]|uniref:STT3 domain-containing protein n=1 Tax=Halosegnis longus TaxID=2216012 RepID=UPI00096A374E|nr:STT3 domain-containing protein [Salella cibi]
MVTARRVADLVADRPALESAIRTTLDAEEPFTFDDLAIDSGAFGEIVGAGIVEEVNDGYRVADREAVEAGLAGNVEHETESSQGWSLPRPDRRVAGALAGALALVALFRVVFAFGPVFQDGAVVLSANDPYYYRYWVEQLLATPDLTLSTLPRTVSLGEPLYVATMWLLASLVGGGAGATGQVLAWYPVVSAVLSGLLVYLLTKRVTDDTRVALAAVVFLAVLPGHAMRTSLGFADHHAFDYPWLGVTALSLVTLVANDVRSRATALGVVGLALGVGGQVLAWSAGPLLILPIGAIAAGLAVVWVRTGKSPLVSGAPILAGLLGGATLVWLGHIILGWHTTVVATAPALLFAGTAVVFGVTEVVARVRPDPRLAGGAVVASGVAGLASVIVLFSDSWQTLRTRASGSLFRSDSIAETAGLFSDAQGWLLLLGFALFLALPALVWTTVQATREDRWLVPVGYCWAFLLLALVQVRFVGELATFVAIFAGLSFVYIVERVDAVRPPVPDVRDSVALPDRQQTGAIVAVFLLVGGLGMLQVPLKTNQLTTPPERYATADWMSEQANQPEWREQPEYVFSPWSYNRVYNYFVNGNSNSYGYAFSNYDSFLASNDSVDWYSRLSDRAGFVVFPTAYGADAPPESIGARLANYGSQTDGGNGLAHYRTVYESSSDRYRIYTLVPGATLTGTAGANETVAVSVSVAGEGFETTYERTVQTNGAGEYSVTVPYAGTYTIGETTAEVSEEAVGSGETVSV